MGQIIDGEGKFRHRRLVAKYSRLVVRWEHYEAQVNADPWPRIHALEAEVIRLGMVIEEAINAAQPPVSLQPTTEDFRPIGTIAYERLARVIKILRDR